MTKSYVVSEIVDEDGGYGDAMPTKIPLAVFENATDAQQYVNQYSHETVYATPYNNLCFGELVVDAVVNEPNQPAKQLPNYDDRSDWL